jgi:hypothetical protein
MQSTAQAQCPLAHAQQTKASMVGHGVVHALANVMHTQCQALGGELIMLAQPAGLASIPAWVDSPTRPWIEAVKREFDPLQQLARGRLPGVQA